MKVQQGQPARGTKPAHKGTPHHGSGGGSQPKSSTGSKTTTPANVPSNVAAPPQVVASRANLLTQLTRGLSSSVQSLDLFYQVPAFLLPIYQAAAVQYGVPWEVLAAINEVETDYGNDQSVSSAGAIGWMQFMPATWLQYGVDAIDAGYADPYNPVDAIFAAARYLAAAGAAKNLRTAVFAYNHSEEYVESVLLRARLLASYPPSAIATLTGLIEGIPPLKGAHVVGGSVDLGAFSGATGPSRAPSPSTAAQAAASHTGKSQTGTGAGPTSGAPKTHKVPLPAPRQFVSLEGPAGAPVVASQSGRVVALGHSRALGNYLALEDVYGDVFTYADLGHVVSRYRLPREGSGGAPTAAAVASQTAQGKAPTQPASAGSQPVTLKAKAAAAATKAGAGAVHGAPRQPAEEVAGTGTEEGVGTPAGGGKVLLYAHPGNPDARIVAARLQAESAAGYGGGLAPLRVGSVVSRGTTLGGATVATGHSTGSLRFAIRPAGDSSAADPQPILQEWDQLQRALHPQGAKGGSGLVGATADSVFLLSRGELQRAVLADPNVALPHCARQEVSAGHIDDRVLAMLLFLSRSGLGPTVSEIRCTQSLPANRGAYSAIDKGQGVDITKIGGVPIAEHQGTGTITDLTIRTLLTLQSPYAPHRIVSLMRYPGAPTTEAAANHADFIEVDFLPPSRSTPSPSAAPASAAAAHSAGPGATAPSPLSLSIGAQSVTLTTAQWNKLFERIAALPQPKVATKPSSAAIRDPRTATSGSRP